MPSEPPRPDGVPLLGNTLAYAADRFAFVEAAREACGDVFVADLLGLGEVCYLTHPDHFERVLTADRGAFGKGDVLRFALGEGLLAVDGEQWERQRAALDRFFYPARIRSYAAEMVRLTERRLDRWVPGEPFSLLEELTALALEIFFGTLFDRDLDADVDRALRRAAADLNGYFTPASLVLPRWLPTPARRRFHRANGTLRAELGRLLDERARAEAAGTAGATEPGDLLSMLARMRAAEDAPMTDDEILDQLVTMVFAGHETSALLLTYALYELGRDAALRERVHAEVDSVLGDDPPTLADLPELAVTERLVTETLRYYPPAHTVPRVTNRDVGIGGYRVPAGTQTFLAVHSVHHDGRFYEAPETFRPARWRDASPQSKGYAYVPFGAGPRTCIGRRFALLEARIVLATVARRFRVDPEEPLELEPLMSLQPAGDVPVTVRRR